MTQDTPTTTTPETSTQGGESAADTATPAERVIVTHGRSLMALAVARSLGRRGIEVIGCDDSPMMALSFSRYVAHTFLHAPKVEDEAAYLDSLIEAVRTEVPDDGRPTVLMPIHEDTTAIARAADRFPPWVRVAAPDVALIDQVFPKDRLARTVERLGVAAPPTRMVEDAASARAAGDAIGYPVFVKPPAATGGRGIAKVDAAEDMDAAFDEARRLDPDRPILVQGLAPGEDYCLTALYQDGVMRAHMAYRNLETFPGAGGFGVLRETVAPGPMPAAADALLSELRWTGVVQLDFRWSGAADDRPHLIEVNPRFWGGLFQSIESGLDYPWLLYRLTVDGAVPEPPPVELGQRTKVPLLWILGAVEDLAEDTGRFDALESAWQDARARARDGAWGKAAGTLGTALSEGLLPTTARERLVARWRNAASARPELFTADDPMAGLGLLYTVGYMIRNGRLPEELSR
ncbi:carboxylate--amine ligase [Roseospira marina]|nr:ATP-grasp domain-containing protein [Roseospira marina]MBB4314720.1 putative ATP-grasp superfamily ATP-dependent carboligase [Roseospira marina]MBB5087709.1 putative ATP-grasp superfamily ATP-dependent carboligase [Roseospira marina]